MQSAIVILLLKATTWDENLLNQKAYFTRPPVGCHVFVRQTFGDRWHFDSNTQNVILFLAVSRLTISPPVRSINNSLKLFSLLFLSEAQRRFECIKAALCAVTRSVFQTKAVSCCPPSLSNPLQKPWAPLMPHYAQPLSRITWMCSPPVVWAH